MTDSKKAVILEARKLEAEGFFDRTPVSREPEDFRLDAIKLSCGHKRLDLRMAKIEKVHCIDCIDEWIAKKLDELEGK